MNAAQHYRAAEAALLELFEVKPQDFPNVAAHAIGHGLLALVGAVVLQEKGADYFPDTHGALVDAVLGRQSVTA